MALQGTLETFSVPEVLRLLAGTRKTGLLALEGDRGAGQVWLRAGRIVGARSAHEPEGEVESVLFDLLRYGDGSFVFETDAEYPGDVAADADVEAALGAAEVLLEEWNEIASVVPSLQVWVSMVPSIASDAVTVTAEQWAALAIVGRGTSAQRLADDLGLGELDGSRRIRDLVDAGLVEVDDTPVEPLTTEPDRLVGPADDLGEAGTWTTTDDLSVGLAGFVARAADEERSERTVPEIAVPEVASFDPPVDEIAFDQDPVADFDLAVVDETEDDVATFGPIAPVEATDDGFEVVLPDDTDTEIDPVEVDPVEVDTIEVDEPVAAVLAGDGDDDEFLSQLANLSPKAAAAIEATASADEAPARRLPNGDGDEEINRNLLLKFLSSAKQ